MTIDRSQVKSLNCVYLYNTEKRESGWNNSFATANALRVLKEQVKVAGGNAIVIRDIYSSEEYRDGYKLDAAGVYIPPARFSQSLTRQTALSVIIFDVEPYPGSMSPLTEALIVSPSTSAQKSTS